MLVCLEGGEVLSYFLVTEAWRQIVSISADGGAGLTTTRRIQSTG